MDCRHSVYSQRTFSSSSHGSFDSRRTPRAFVQRHALLVDSSFLFLKDSSVQVAAPKFPAACCALARSERLFLAAGSLRYLARPLRCFSREASECLKPLFFLLRRFFSLSAHSSSRSLRRPSGQSCRTSKMNSDSSP